MTSTHRPRRVLAAAGLALAALLVGPSPAPASTGTASAADYYVPVAGLSGAALKDGLHDLIDGNTQLSYDQVWDGLKDVDEDPQDPSSVRLLYSPRTEPKSDNGGNVGQWNREHTWAQSHGDFGTTRGPGTDLHHLRPEDVQVNGTRGNKDFDDGGSPVSGASGSFTDGDSFEPRDAVKGDVARMILYMAVRYEGDDGAPDLEMSDAVGNGSRPLHGRLSVLKQWNDQDPPDAFERGRNEKVYADWQGNRNPFVDHPEWVESIW